MRKAIMLLIGGIVLLYLVFSTAYNNFISETVTPEKVVIFVEEGDTLDDVSVKLGIGGIMFKIYVRNNQGNFKLQEGKFEVEGGANIETVFKNLENPIYDEVTLKILEGWNIYDIDMCLSDPIGMLEASKTMCLYEEIDGEKKILDGGIINKGEYIDYVTNKEKIEALTEYFPFIDGLNTLEGFLYPDTYKIDRTNFGINKTVIKQLETFENKVVNKITKKYLAPKWEEIVNLASIVEKEEKNPEQKATVAGILKKRLNQGRMIGADITVCYPHQLSSENCKLVVSKYIKEKNDYNTRTMTGLPLTPIGNPTYETIQATINSKNTPYYFYLHDGNGNIYFAETNAQHEYNKSSYMR